MDKVMELKAINPKSYEKELQSDEPFVRTMYEDLERRIEEFEDDIVNAHQKTSIKDLVSVTVITAIITVGLFLI